MRLFVAVTDNEWYWHLRSRSVQDEANFWLPGGGRSFQALAPGELLLFKPHTPHHSIVGGGFFLHASELPCSLAWEFFGAGNGASGWWQMRRRIERFRHLAQDSQRDYSIGCILLQRPFFFDEADWISLPDDFSKNVGLGKVYETSTPEGKTLWEKVRRRLHASQPGTVNESQFEMFGEPSFVQPPLGLGGFRLLVVDAYERRCAMSGSRILPSLEVTHIRPPLEGGMNRIDNGLLLRSDLRRLFDLGYLSVGPQNEILVSSTLTGEFPDASDLHDSLDSEQLQLPPHVEHHPRREFLDWHRSKVYRS